MVTNIAGLQMKHNVNVINKWTIGSIALFNVNAIYINTIYMYMHWLHKKKR